MYLSVELAMGRVVPGHALYGYLVDTCRVSAERLVEPAQERGPAVGALGAADVERLDVLNLGVALGALGNPEEITEYKKTLEIDADYVPAYLNWGGALYSKGQYEEAVELYKKALVINPLSAGLHYSLSIALDQLNRKEEAAAEAALAGKIDPKYAGR